MWNMSSSFEYEEAKLASTGGKGLGEQSDSSSFTMKGIISTEEEECLKQLKKLIKEDEFVSGTGVSDDEELLLAFVRGRKYNAEKAFKTLQNHVYVTRVKYLQFFQSLSPRKCQYLLDAPRVGGLLKHRDINGCRIGVARCAPFNPQIHNVDDLIMGGIMASLEFLRTVNGPRNGVVIIYDASDFGWRHAREFSIARLNFSLSIYLNAYPVQYKAFHILNNKSYLFDTILAIVKQFSPKKLRDRIHLHGNNLESLHQHVPREILPESLGGLVSEEEAYDLTFEKKIIERIDYYENFPPECIRK